MKESRRRIFAVAALLLIAASGAIGADCARRGAEPATVPQVAQHPEPYQGKCVVIEGVLSGDSLFGSVDGVYLREKEFQNPASSGFRLGLDNLPATEREGFRHVSIVGQVQDCETTRNIMHANSGDDEISMIAGYCHTSNGAYLWIKDLKFRSGAPFVRQMGSYERKDYGDIAPVPADWPHRQLIESLAEKFIAALRANDRDALADMHFRNVGLQWKDDEAAMMRLLLDDPRSPFESLRHETTSPQRLILAERFLLNPDSDEEKREAAENYSSIVCFCRTQDCSGRWPLASFDADNLPSRPYACTTIDRYSMGHRWVPQFTTASARAGLAEPPAHTR